MNLVVDASVALKWFFADRNDESHSKQALNILNALDSGWVQMIQPPHFMAEMAAVLVREKGAAAMADLEDLEILDWQVLDTSQLYREAIHLANDLDHHLFDTLYHAVTHCLSEAMLVTADRRYYRKASALDGICLIGDLILPDQDDSGSD